jgi:two-component system, NtrC family, sensor kinase
VHKLLERQLRKHFPAEPPGAPQFATFVASIDAAYRESDASRTRLERSIELASAELTEQNAQLQRDLEAIRRLELELRQAEKLRAVGQLAAGVAHEINTPIQYIGDSVQFVKEALVGLLELAKRAQHRDDGTDARAMQELREVADEIDLEFLLEEVPKALEQTADGVRRVANIVSAMKDFGRADSREKTLADVNRCVQSTLLVAQNELKYVAEVEVSLGALPLVPCFAGELSQVFLNLLVNAAHAIAERQRLRPERGLIRVTTAQRGVRVAISVADDGAGIAREHQARIFEPFFTTKAVGDGTGQGLAIARSIVVEKHSGSLSFESTPGVGTTFTVLLPTVAQADATTQVARHDRRGATL